MNSLEFWPQLNVACTLVASSFRAKKKEAAKGGYVVGHMHAHQWCAVIVSYFEFADFFLMSFEAVMYAVLPQHGM